MTLSAPGRGALCLALALGAFAAFAQDGQTDASENVELRCIRVRSISRVRSIDESTVAFYLGRRNVYINVLPRRCPGIARTRRYAYETRGGRLCSKDVIAPIYDLSGEDIGLPCPLGEFRRVDAQVVEQMIAAAERGGGPPPVTAESVELPDPEAGESASNEPGAAERDGR